MPLTNPEPAVRILIAEDDDLVRHGIRSILDREPGYVVVGEAENGQQAVALALELLPDIIVMDLTMPHVDGLEATRRIAHVY